MYQVLCVLLALGGARADACDGSRPVHIWGYTEGAKSEYIVRMDGYLGKMYSSPVDIYCSGSLAKDLIISWNGVQHPAEAVDTKTLKLITLKKFEIGSHVLNCTDMVTMCNATLLLVVGPDAVIVSHNVRQKRLSLFYSFFVPIGEDYEVLCCGGQTDSLQILNYINENPTITESVRVNETCIQSIILDKLKERALYSCKILLDGYRYIETAVGVYIDYPLAVSNFWCVEYVGTVRCSWNVAGSDTTFNLLYMDEFGNSIHVCEDLTNKKTSLCEWRIYYARLRGVRVGGRLHFVLQICNIIFCNNETYNINRDTISKSKSPLKFNPLRIGSYSAKLQWSGYYGDKAKYYKIKYSLAGTEWLEVDSSSIHINDTMGIPYYSVDLTLPCSDSLYEVKVYARYITTPQSNDAYWSDPARMSFYTEPRGNSTVEEDPNKCNTEAEMLSTDSAGAYRVKLLRKDVRKDGVKLHKDVKTLRQKRAALEELRRSEL